MSHSFSLFSAKNNISRAGIENMQLFTAASLLLALQR
jgi:hypothetical protein